MFSAIVMTLVTMKAIVTTSVDQWAM